MMGARLCFAGQGSLGARSLSADTLPWVGQRNHCHLPLMESSKEGRATLTPDLSPTASFPPPKPGGLPFLCLSCEGPSWFETPAGSSPEDPIGPRSHGRAAELCHPSPKDLAHAGAFQGSSSRAPALLPAGTISSDCRAGVTINFHPSGLLLGKFAN